MIIILVHSHFDKAHLAAVVEEMKTMGTPTIKVWDYEDGFGTYQAIEGCHRLRACEILEIVPNIIVLDKDVPLLDTDDNPVCDWNGDYVETIGEIGNINNYNIEFDG